MKHFFIVLLFVVGCANNPPQKTGNSIQLELLPDLKKFPVQEISIECTIPTPSRVRKLDELFNGGFIDIEAIYLMADQKEIWVLARLEVENFQAPEHITTATVSASVYVRVPNVPIKYYIISKKHWDEYDRFNKGRSYIYEGSRNVIVPIFSTMLYPRAE